MKYGISDYDDNSTDVVFGDGETCIGTYSLDNGLAGVNICRDGRAPEPFYFEEYSDRIDDNIADDSKRRINVLFDNPRSVQAMIDRLEQVKEFLQK